MFNYYYYYYYYCCFSLSLSRYLTVNKDFHISISRLPSTIQICWLGSKVTGSYTSKTYAGPHIKRQTSCTTLQN